MTVPAYLAIIPSVTWVFMIDFNVSIIADNITKVFGNIPKTSYVPQILQEQIPTHELALRLESNTKLLRIRNITTITILSCHRSDLIYRILVAVSIVSPAIKLRFSSVQ